MFLQCHNCYDAMGLGLLHSDNTFNAIQSYNQRCYNFTLNVFDWLDLHYPNCNIFRQEC